MIFPLPSPYPPDVDAHIWRGFRPIRGQLSVGLLMRRTDEAQQWAARVLNLLIADPALKLDAVFRAVGLPSGNTRENLLFRSLHGRSQRRAAPFQRVPLAVRPACCFIDVDYDDERCSFTDEAREAIRKRDLDVLLWLDSHILYGDCSGLARLGVWSFYFGDPERAPVYPPYWREVVEGDSVSAIALRRHTERFEKGELLASHSGPTDPSWAFTETADRLAAMAAPILSRSLLDALECPGRFREQAEPPEMSSSESIRAPSTFEAARFVAARSAHSLRVRMQGHTRQHKRWFVALRRKDKAANEPFHTGGFMEMGKPPGSGYADPFLIEREGRHWLFVEELPPGASKGRLTCFEILDTRHLGEACVILDEPFHLAYPCVFTHRNDCYLLPDSAANKTVSLYRAIQFPHRWEPVSCFVEGKAVVDTTPLFLDGMWYFFTTTKEPGSETFLFYSAKLEGPWRYHPANPICSDARRARAAGALFYRDGKLIRPSQDCALGYGHSIVFNEITRLSPSEYAERVVQRIPPNWRPNLIGTHTYNSDGTYEVIDGVRFER